MSTTRTVRARRRTAAPRLFAEAPGAPASRRPADVVAAITAGTAGLVLATVGPGGRRDLDLARAVRTVGGSIEPVWQVLHDLGLLWCLAILVAAVVRRQVRTATAMVVAVLVGIAAGRIAPGLVDGAVIDLGSLVESVGTATRTTAFPAMRVLVLTAALGAAAPSLARPMRRIGRTLLAVEALAAIALAVTTPVGAAAGWAIGAMAAALTHLALGSPGGRPSIATIRDALRELEVPVRDLAPTVEHHEGVAVLRGTLDDGGDVAVKLYGRDAIDGRVLTAAWRGLWYRDRTTSALVGRRQLVEHEAFLTLLAERHGVPVPAVVTAGTTDQGDDVLVVRDAGRPCDAPDVALTDDDLDALWHALATLHAAGIAHRRIDPSRLGRRTDGSIALTDWAAASVAAPPDLFLHDRAQLLVTTVLLADVSRAVAALLRALDDDAVAAMLPYLQEPALGRTLNRHLDRAQHDLDELRSDVATAIGSEEPELVALRRVTWGSVARLALLMFAGWLFVSSIADIGLATIVDEIAKGDVVWIAVALLVGQLPRLASACSTLGAAPVALPYGPTAALEYAITFVNLAVPSSLGRMATKLRFLQRQGVGFAGATAMSALDNIAGFAMQIAVLGLTLGLGLGHVDLDLDLDVPLPAHLLPIVAAVVGVLALVTVLVPPVRRRVVPALVEIRTALGVLRSPRKAALLLGGNVGSEVLFAATLGVCLHAFGGSASLIDLLVINTLVALFAGLMPVPGGIGVSEAALTAGLGLLGVDPDTGFAVAMTYRLCTFYLPPIWGAVALRWLERHRYL